MKKLTPSFIATVVCLSIYSHDSLAEIDRVLLSAAKNQCLADVPVYNRPVVKGDIKNLPVEIQSNRFETDIANYAIYSGNVLAKQGNRTVSSEQIIINQTANNNRNLIIKGHLFYQDNLLEMRGDKADIDLDTENVKIQNGKYHLVGRLGRGSADNMAFNNNRYIVLNKGSFTSCPIGNSAWNIEGSEIIFDNQEQLLEVWNAVFKIGRVPVMYSPYLQLPTGNKRRSGLLMPEFSYDSIDGIDVSVPFYWNIAPNYDATFSPRIIQRRGVQLQTEMRYLNYVGSGVVAFDWLQHDKLYSNDKKDSQNSGYGDNNYRWLFHWKNKQLLDDNWRFNVDVTRVSDNQYITDLGSKYASQTDGYLTQNYQLGYTDQYWDIGLNYKYFQALRSDIRNELYRTQPQLNINYYNNDVDGIKFRTFSQISHFISNGSNNPNAWRFHIEPTVDYTIFTPWASVSTEAGFMATHYNQDIPAKINNDGLKRDVNRFIPKVGIDGKMIFSRQISLFDGYTQTLEPRIKYIYIPYRNQSQIRNYDSSLQQSDYIGLFRDQPYSGLDRIVASNKMATGLTTRFYDENKVEKFNLSLGQIYYFTKSRTGDSNSSLDQKDDTGSLTWAADTFWRISPDIITRSGIQYDTKINEVSLANAIIEYRKSENKLIQLTYRYANKNYINSINYSNLTTPYQQKISQFGMITSWPLTDTLSAVGAVFYDVDNQQSSNSYIGLHYADCCWGVRVQYGRKINDWNSVSKESLYENKFSINFELRGLNKDNDITAKMLDFGLLPYKTAFEEDY